MTTATQVIAAVRATLAGADDDQGIAVPFSGLANLVPADENSLVYARTPQVRFTVIELRARPYSSRHLSYTGLILVCACAASPLNRLRHRQPHQARPLLPPG